jgi:hypothetical protein
MSKTLSALLLALWMAYGLASTASAQPELTAIDGYVKDQQFQPLRGVTTYLVHPTKGRSQPVFTDANGYYAFSSVPLALDSYYIEVYWGRNLLYRVSVNVDGFVHMPDIILG